MGNQTLIQKNNKTERTYWNPRPVADFPIFESEIDRGPIDSGRSNQKHRTRLSTRFWTSQPVEAQLLAHRKTSIWEIFYGKKSSRGILKINRWNAFKRFLRSTESRSREGHFFAAPRCRFAAGTACSNWLTNNPMRCSQSECNYPGIDPDWSVDLHSALEQRNRKCSLQTHRSLTKSRRTEPALLGDRQSITSWNH